ncbi:LysR substrate-binding domain-containing protein [Arhodomonas sp. AD133]|uniref:LysR substrate-binding domain-containing protein n=1 Tax=Arhodomonas sp. AD133 TaxID=3415009 RepID=UPI003EBFA869
MINLRQIEAFRAVMMHKTVTRAAEVLYVSQPAVSRLITDLEGSIGFPLFQRRKGRLVPTPEAEGLYEEVEKSFVGLEKITTAAREIREFRTGSLFICSMPALALAFLPPVLQAYSTDNPGVTVSLQVHSSQRVAEWVATQQCDLGLVGMDLDETGVRQVALGSAPLRLVMPPDHPLAGQQTVHVEDLADVAFVSLGQLQDVRPAVDRVFHEAGVRRRLRIETQLSAVACEFVLAGSGVALVDPVTASGYAARGLTSRPFSPAIPFHYSALVPDFRPPSRVTRAFLALLSERLEAALDF